VGIKHILLGPIKSYDSLSDIKLQDTIQTPPLNEQVVLKLDQHGLNYFIISVQFAIDTTGIYSNIMDNKALGKVSSRELS
jgi:hypothetical protein